MTLVPWVFTDPWVLPHPWGFQPPGGGHTPLSAGLRVGVLRADPSKCPKSKTFQVSRSSRGPQWSDLQVTVPSCHGPEPSGSRARAADHARRSTHASALCEVTHDISRR